MSAPADQEKHFDWPRGPQAARSLDRNRPQLAESLAPVPTYHPWTGANQEGPAMRKDALLALGALALAALPLFPGTARSGGS